MAIAKARKFGNGLQKLKGVIEESGIIGEWTEGADYHAFKSEDGGVLNYWPKTSTINFQGTASSKMELEAVIDTWESSKPSLDNFFE